MRTPAYCLAVLSIAAAPAFAEAGNETAEEGFSLLEQGARIILRSMLDEVQPTLEDLRKEFGQAIDDMGPVLKDLAGMIGDIRNYEPPEMLPNGDIIMRRKTPLGPDVSAPGAEIEI